MLYIQQNLYDKVSANTASCQLLPLYDHFWNLEVFDPELAVLALSYEKTKIKPVNDPGVSQTLWAYFN